MRFDPYLNFGGNCREAFTRYQEILGGELVLLGASDVPSDVEMAPEQADLIMHAALKLGDQLLMASDDIPDRFSGVRGMWVSITTGDPAEAERWFAALAEGGEITMPMGETFWSPKFGMCVDRFGTPWMIGVEGSGAPEPA